jgi:hypothetical protein
MFKYTLKLSLKAIGAGALLGALLFFVNGRSLSQTKDPRIVTTRQTNSPLLLLSTGVESTNPLEPHYWYSVTNTSEKPVSAYAITQRVSLGPGTPITSTSFTYLPSANLILRPHESRQENGGVGKSYPKAPIEITLNVDFVEFVDGTRWGEDLGKSGDRLDGLRSGGQEAIKRYRDVLNLKGVAGLEAAMSDSSFLKPSSEAGRSTDWQDGFRTGVNTVTQRLISAKTKGGLEGVKSELDRPLGSKNEGREP